MRVCYQILTHRSPEQVHRLVAALAETSRDPLVLVDHDRNGPPLRAEVWEGDARVVVRSSAGGYGGWTHLARYFDNIELLESLGLAYDWMVTISGQDYPLRPLSAVENDFLQAEADGFDGFLEYFPVLSAESPWPRELARTRYWFHYRQLSQLSEQAAHRLRPIGAVNRLQPLVRVHVATGLRVGWRARTPFRAGFTCYGGSFFSSLSRRCIDYLQAFRRDSPEIEAHYRQTLASAESFIQTVLINSGEFSFVNSCKRYFDFRGSQLGHPRLLDVRDVAPASESGAHFARKWDMERDPDAFEAMDRLVYDRATPSSEG